MNKRNLAFDRTNFILLAIGFAVVVIGFVLMGGSPSTEEAFNADIFSVRRIRVAPVVCFIGFVSMIYAVVHKPKGDGVEEEDAAVGSVDTMGDAEKETEAVVETIEQK